jgi:hypothetical protein
MSDGYSNSNGNINVHDDCLLHTLTKGKAKYVSICCVVKYRLSVVAVQLKLGNAMWHQGQLKIALLDAVHFREWIEGHSPLSGVARSGGIALLPQSVRSV